MCLLIQLPSSDIQKENKSKQHVENKYSWDVCVHNVSSFYSLTVFYGHLIIMFQVIENHEC